MLYYANTLKNLRDAVDSFIKVCGENTQVGSNGGEDSDGEYVNDLIRLDLVFVGRDGTIVGEEAEDYKPKDGEIACVRIY